MPELHRWMKSLTFWRHALQSITEMPQDMYRDQQHPKFINNRIIAIYNIGIVVYKHWFSVAIGKYSLYMAIQESWKKIVMPPFLQPAQSAQMVVKSFKNKSVTFTFTFTSEWKWKSFRKGLVRMKTRIALELTSNPDFTDGWADSLAILQDLVIQFSPPSLPPCFQNIILFHLPLGSILHPYPHELRCSIPVSKMSRFTFSPDQIKYHCSKFILFLQIKFFLIFFTNSWK